MRNSTNLVKIDPFGPPKSVSSEANEQPTPSTPPQVQGTNQASPNLAPNLNNNGTSLPQSNSRGLVQSGLHPLPGWIRRELRRRSKEYGQNPSEQISNYAGPRSAWIRVCSNGISKHPDAQQKDGFVLGGIHGFNDSYGFNSSGKIKIGVDVNGNAHEIPIDSFKTFEINGESTTRADFPHRPPPSIESLTCELNGANSGFHNLTRQATIQWKCNTLGQLNYLIPYFFTPSITCIFEWGWNNYDTVSLVDLTDIKWISEMFTIPERSLDWIERSNGNYDVAVGFISDFGYKLNDLGGYDCYTTIRNANRMIEGAAIDNRVVVVKSNNEDAKLKTLKEFATQNLMSIDSGDSIYVEMRKNMGLTDPVVNTDIKRRVFRISNNASPKNDVKDSNKLWLRMDLVQDIINSFYKSVMDDSLNSPINEFNIKNVAIAANPFLKSVNHNVLVPNQYAPRLTAKTTNNTAQITKIEDGIYENLFKDKLSSIAQGQDLTEKVDDLRSIINPYGNSFPVYQRLQDSYGPGKWGYLSDLFFNAYTLKQLIEQNNTLLRLLEAILETINQSLCQICQLKLIPSEYSNGLYSVIDNNMPGVSDSTTAGGLTKIKLGALESAYIKNAQFEIKISSDMMGQTINQSANILRDGDTFAKNISASPLKYQYSMGDRLFTKVNQDKKVLSDDGQATRDAATTGTAIAQLAANAFSPTRATLATAANVLLNGNKKNEIKKNFDRDENNSNNFFIYHKKVLTLPPQTSNATGEISVTTNTTGSASAQEPATQSTPAIARSSPFAPASSSDSAPLIATQPTSIIPSFNQEDFLPQLPTATVGTAYSQRAYSNFDNNDGLFEFETTGLPPGLTLDNTGLISGTPTTAGSFTIIIIATNTQPPVQSSRNTVRLTVIASPATPSIARSSPFATASSSDSAPLTATQPTASVAGTSVVSGTSTETSDTYILYEKTKEFINYVLNQPTIKSSYGAGSIMPGTTLTLEFAGISGINYLSQFTLDHVPEPYNYMNAVWQVNDIKHEVSGKNWTTVIIAQVRPLIEANARQFPR